MNYEHGNATKRSKYLSAILHKNKPDVVLLQEVDVENLNLIARKTNLNPVVHTNQESGCGVLLNKNLTLLDKGVYDLVDDVEEKKIAWVAVQSITERTWHIQTAHLAWGHTKEGVRLKQAKQLNSEALKSTADVKIIGLDANTTPNSATMRYLFGLDPDENNASTMWVDVASYLQQKPVCTSCPENPHARETAKIVGIPNHSQIPHRQIDYLMVQGYAYGKPGFALSAKILGKGKKTPSDHYGIYGKMWDPEKISSITNNNST